MKEKEKKNKLDFTVRSQKDLEDAVRSCGILPLFRNAIPGYSVEDHAHPSCWFADGDGVWEWKGPVIRNTGCAYGKFFGNKAVFMTREWFLDFANWRRDGYDFDARFDDELASYQDKRLYDLLDAQAPVLSGDLKKSGNYRKGGSEGFETIITRLQAQGYVLISDFVYRTDRFGNPYGWGVAQYTTPEKLFGKEFRENVYCREPEESYERIRRQVQSLLPDCDPKDIGKFLLRASGAEGLSGNRIWLVPSNPKYYDVVGEFNRKEVLFWKQGNDSIRVGDIVYLYVGAPYSAILYRCEVLETDIPYDGPEVNVNIRKMMRIRRLEIYPPEKLHLSVLKKYDVVSVRCTRSMPAKLDRDIRIGKLK